MKVRGGNRQEKGIRTIAEAFRAMAGETMALVERFAACEIGRVLLREDVCGQGWTNAKKQAEQRGNVEGHHMSSMHRVAVAGVARKF